MKRDWDLLRKQLTDIEEDRNVLAEIPEEPKYQDQSWDEFDRQLKEVRAIEARICGHLELLIANGYLEGIKIRRGADGSFGYSVASPRLTWAGHDLLATMRSSSVWESIKTTAKNKGIELTFDAIKSIAETALEQVLGS